MQQTSYYICEPYLDQSLTISSFLNRYYGASVTHFLSNNRCRSYKRMRLFRYKYELSLPEIDISSPKYQIVPTGAYSTKYVLDRQDARVGQITLSKEAVRVYDKVWAIEAAHSAGISTPLTWKNIEDIRSYPLFYKQSYEQGGGIRGIARSETELPRKKDGIIFQELIQSKGTYGVAFLADRGKIISYHMHYESESYPKQGGSAVVIENFSSKELLDYSVRLIEGIDYSGWGLIEYKYCPRRNTFVFMEINAKFWASCEFTFRNNPSFLKLLFDIESREIPVERMLFLERAIARGFPFLMALPGFLIQGSTVHVYPGWLFRLALRLTPASLRSLAKHVLQGQHS